MKESSLQKYYHMVYNLVEQFEEIKINCVPREENYRVDVLSKLANTKKTGQHRTHIQQTLSTPSWI